LIDFERDAFEGVDVAVIDLYVHNLEHGSLTKRRRFQIWVSPPK
jgi:hypothetical protein